ncbi:MAG: aminoacetone oxidase family FAD-binding enzyme, partial [Lachnospiraceae bacterium]|nr:aminoacetone oxidase family FAD-binding enzyme [Lachnospiraceae bacterium]
MSKVLIIGGGASGMMCAAAAASAGHEVHIFEKNEKLGKKLFITGKGRCNLTNDSPVEEHIRNIETNPKFMYSALYTFDSSAVTDFFESRGLRLKTERGNRVFPASDHSSDVIRTLERVLKESGVHVHLHAEVKGLMTGPREDAPGLKVRGIKLADGEVCGDAVVIATGGLSYAATGSTGDGYRFAEETGHEVMRQSPALVPVNTRESFVRELAGLSLKNVRLSVYEGSKEIFSDMGEMLFTHTGISGP